MGFISRIKYNISNIVKNDDMAYEIPVQNEDGTAFDFTGWTGKAEVRTTTSSPTPILTFDTAGATMTLSSGLITLIQPLANMTMNAGTYVWDLEFNDADGNQSTLIIASNFIVIDDVTNV